MGENYEYVWLFPLICGILTILAVLTPTASFNIMGVSWSWWMWNLIVLSATGVGSESVFISEANFIIPSLITTIIMIFNIICLFTLAFKAKSRKLDTKNFTSVSIIIGALLIGITIYYISAIDNAFYEGLVLEGVPFPPGYHFWDIFNPSFGVIGPFLSAILAFIGAAVFQHFLKRKEDMIPLDKVMTEKIETETITPPLKGLNFCPECGNKVISTTQRFCMNCGFELQQI